MLDLAIDLREHVPILTNSKHQHKPKSFRGGMLKKERENEVINKELVVPVVKCRENIIKSIHY